MSIMISVWILIPFALFTKETICRETGLAILLRLLWKAHWKAMRPVGPTKPWCHLDTMMASSKRAVVMSILLNKPLIPMISFKKQQLQLNIPVSGWFSRWVLIKSLVGFLSNHRSYVLHKILQCWQMELGIHFEFVSINKSFHFLK